MSRTKNGSAGDTERMHGAKVRIWFLLVALLSWAIAWAQPGVAAPAGLAIKVAEAGRLLDGQHDRLVWIEDVRVSGLELYESQAGRRHLRFVATISGQPYAAIQYEGDWTDADRTRLTSGRAHLLGVWDEFRGEPSLVVKWVEEVGGVYDVASVEQPANSPGVYVRIDGARPFEVEKFVSRTLRMHARFQFTVDGAGADAYSGIVYEGTWTSELLDRLRSGQAVLIGYWDTSAQEPFFVVSEVR